MSSQQTRARVIERSNLDRIEAFDMGWFPKYLTDGDQVIASRLCSFEIRFDELRNEDDRHDRAIARFRVARSLAS